MCVCIYITDTPLPTAMARDASGLRTSVHEVRFPSSFWTSCGKAVPRLRQQGPPFPRHLLVVHLHDRVSGKGSLERHRVTLWGCMHNGRVGTNRRHTLSHFVFVVVASMRTPLYMAPMAQPAQTLPQLGCKHGGRVDSNKL